MIGLIALLAAMTAEPAGCADHWMVELDEESFASNGAGRQFTPLELVWFGTRLATDLQVAAADACRSGKLTPSRAAAVRRVRAFSASGAAEPHFYSHGKGTLKLEWTFAEQDLAVPPRATLVGGLICWSDPASADCSDQGD